MRECGGRLVHSFRRRGRPPAPILAPSHAVGHTHNCTDYYPEFSRRWDESGDVLVRYDVGADGKISNVTVARSSGHAALDEAAIVCVSQRWRNTPALRDGVPVASPDHQAIIRFTLHGEGDSWLVYVATYWLIAAVGALAVLGWIVAGFRRWIFRARICPSCQYRNRGIVPFVRPGYCSDCGTNFAKLP